MQIAAVGSALPKHYYSQDEILTRLEREWAGQHYNTERLRRLHENVLVGGRYLALPMERYDELLSFGDTNDAWIEVGLEVGALAIERALGASGVDRERLGALFFVTVTGLAVPSLDARLMNQLDLPRSLRRVPIFGLGCVAGAAGVARAADYVRAYPEQAALLLSVELCSLTLQRGDLTIPNLVASGLFGDGAAAVVVRGALCPSTLDSGELKPGERNPGEPGLRHEGDGALGEACRPGPEILASASVLYPNSEHVMGWRISERGFGVVLSADVPTMVTRYLRRDVEAFLGGQGLTLGDIESFVAHPGGPKVLLAMQEAFAVDESAFDLTWRSLREVGNLSSTSVLLVLERTMNERRPRSGSFGLLLAMGPGFCSELVLLKW